MIPIPFFLTKIFDLMPKFSFSYINHDKPKQLKKRPGYIKHIESNQWYHHNGQITPRVYSNGPYHQQVCARYYQMETLDGSEYYLCQHGARVR